MENEPSIELLAVNSKQIGIAAVTVEHPSSVKSPAVVVMISENPRDFTQPFVFSMLTPKQAERLADDLRVKAKAAMKMIKNQRSH